MKNNTYVSIETVIQGSSENAISFKCKTEKQAMQLRNTLTAAPELLETLEHFARQVTRLGPHVQAALQVELKQVGALIAKAKGE